MFPSVSFTVPARAAIAGNPSDGHGGTVVATTVPSLAATVTCESDTHFSFGRSTDRFASVAEIAEWVDSENIERDQPLMHAALSVLYQRFDAALAPCRFSFSTTIPRSLGLAGSSAIVVGTLMCAVGANEHERWAQRLANHPALVASLALEAERDLLGIAAGLQDRVVQAFGGTVAMEFGDEHMRFENGLPVGDYRALGDLPGDLFVAYRDGTGGDSGRVHGAVDTTSAAFSLAMANAADAGRAAIDAIERHDVQALGSAMDATFDQRALVYRLEPAHVEMIDVARSAGASANFTGSGGSIIVLAANHRAAAALTDIGCTIVSL